MNFDRGLVSESSPRRLLFLDLEDTIITPVLDGWHKTELINVQLIKRLIREFDPDTINLFSFALHNEREVALFNKHCRPMIETAIGHPLDLTPTVDDHIVPTCCNVLGLSKDRVDFSDAGDFWSKQQSFRLWLRGNLSLLSRGFGSEVLLLDDVVFNEQFSWPDDKISGWIVNVDTL